tara:strand:- start:1353 stop:1838 length:486 start_codon:yes stop_codon:yes gene_type:complete
MGSTLTVDNIVGATTAANVKLPAGSVLQTVHSQTTTSQTTASQTYVDSDLHVTITPKYSSSKILVRASVSLYNVDNASVATATIKRGSTELSGATYGFGYIYTAAAGGHVNQIPMEVLDSPSTTSATTYRVMFSRGFVNVGTAYLSVNGTVSSITAMEIAQ